MKIAHCPRYNQEIHFYTDAASETIDCPRCGLALIVEEGGGNESLSIV